MSSAREILVFGSNTSGIHGAGSALYARLHYGAIYGQGIGIQGNAFAIPTKNASLKVLPLSEIRPHVERFIEFARQHPELTFKVVDIGCGLAGYRPEDIAPMFRGAPANCRFSERFQKILKGGSQSPVVPQRKSLSSLRPNGS
jgi:hypothetical protein